MVERNKLHSKILLLIFLGLFFITLVDAEVQTIGPVKQNDCIDLMQTCSNCTYSNLTSVVYPNQTKTIISELMTKNGVEYNFSYCNTSIIGNYVVNGYSDVDGSDTVWAYDFDVTYSGNALSVQTSLLYLGLLGVITFLLLFILFQIPKLPSKDNVDKDNMILSVNKLKYLRPVLYGLSWGLLLAIFFLSANVALAFLPSTMFGEFLFTIYTVMMVLTLPLVIVWFIWIFYRIFKDKEMKNMLERGVQFRAMP